MSTQPQKIKPPFIAQPPIGHDFQDKDGNISGPWMDWVNSITRVMGYCIVMDYLTDVDGNIVRSTPVLTAISLTTAERNSLKNKFNGTILYNETTNRMNFRENGAWVTFTPVPA